MDGGRRRLVLDANLSDRAAAFPAADGRVFWRYGEAAEAGALGPWSVRWSLETPMIPPRATYRLQLRKSFGFADAAKLAPYLAALGISHAYLSPVFKARPGSTHGYDITDHSELNPELGTEADYEAMIAAFRREGLSVILDYRAEPHGRRRRRQSALARRPRMGSGVALRRLVRHRLVGACGAGGGKLLAPVLGEQYGEALRRRQARAQVRRGGRDLRRLGLRRPQAAGLLR